MSNLWNPYSFEQLEQSNKSGKRTLVVYPFRTSKLRHSANVSFDASQLSCDDYYTIKARVLREYNCAWTKEDETCLATLSAEKAKTMCHDKGAKLLQLISSQAYLDGWKLDLATDRASFESKTRNTSKPDFPTDYPATVDKEEIRGTIGLTIFTDANQFHPITAAAVDAELQNWTIGEDIQVKEMIGSIMEGIPQDVLSRHEVLTKCYEYDEALKLDLGAVTEMLNKLAFESSSQFFPEWNKKLFHPKEGWADFQFASTYNCDEDWPIDWQRVAL